MYRHPWDRLLAWVIDCLCILVWVVVVAAVGVPLYLAGITGGLTVVAQNILATVILVVPVTLMLAGFESSAREASIGKRVRHLLVVNSRTGQRVSFRRAIARNTMKLAVPWHGWACGRLQYRRGERGGFHTAIDLGDHGVRLRTATRLHCIAILRHRSNPL